MKDETPSIVGMRVGITGSSGLVGSALREHLQARGAACVRFVRGAAGADDRAWNPRACLDGTAMPSVDGLDAVVHLAGASIAAGRWSRRRKAQIRESRVLSTRTMALAMARASEHAGPRTMICASAIGYYGDCGDRPVDESSPHGDGFLADVVREWEGAAEPARAAGVRVVHARFGVVLSRMGGALRAMLPAFRMGIGGPLGSGRQGFSWISLEDAIGAVEHCIVDSRAVGPVNLVAEAPCSQREFARALGASLHRWAILPAPAPFIRLALGEMGDELLLRGAFVHARRLRELGYSFANPSLAAALAAILHGGIGEESAS